MADVGAWGAAMVAVSGAIGTVIAAARQPADVATLRAEVKSAKDEAPAAVKAAVDAVRAALDDTIGKVRGDLAGVARRVGVLEDWRKHAHAANEARPTIVSGSDLSAQVDREHERRISDLERDARATSSALTDARVILARIEGNLDAAVRKGSR